MRLVVKNLLAALAVLAALSSTALAQQGSWVPSSQVGGTANAITLGSVPGVGAMSDLVGVHLGFIPQSSNLTGGTTINVNGLGNVTVKRSASGGLVALLANDLTSGVLAEVVYDGTQFVDTNPVTLSTGIEILVNGTACYLGSSCTITAAAGAVNIGGTQVESATNGYILTNASGYLGDVSIASLLTAGTDITITGTTNVTIGLTNASMVVNSTTCTLGSSCTLSNVITGVTAGTGLNGGGTSGNVTLNANITGITAGSGLTGGGSSGNVTLSAVVTGVTAGGGLTSSTTSGNVTLTADVQSVTAGTGITVSGGANPVVSLNTASASDVQAGTSAALAITPFALKGAMPLNLSGAPNGCQTFPDGLIMMWGSGDLPTGNGDQISFPCGGFPNNAYSVVVVGAVSLGTPEVNVTNPANLTKGSFFVFSRNYNGSIWTFAPFGFSWVAYGN